MPQTIRASLQFSLVVLLVASFLNASVGFERSRVWMASSSDVGIRLPSATSMRMATLNQYGWAADIGWVAAVVDHGETKRTGRISDNLEHNSYVVSESDPGFLPVYEWYSAAYLNNLGVVEPSDIERVNQFIKAGMVNHPNDYRLPYAAALNYLGYSASLTGVQRLIQVNTAIGLLEQASSLSKTDDSIPLLLSWFYARKRKLTNEATASDDAKTSEIAFNLRLLQQTASPSVRAAVRENLRFLGASDNVLVVSIEQQQRKLDLRLLESQPYLPLDLWLSLQDEQP